MAIIFRDHRKLQSGEQQGKSAPSSLDGILAPLPLQVVGVCGEPKGIQEKAGNRVNQL